jgi:hypothetical protein
LIIEAAFPVFLFAGDDIEENITMERLLPELK